MYDMTTGTHLPPSYRLKKITNVSEEELRRALDQVVGEFFEEEREDFDENPAEDHPYHALRVVHAYLYGA